MEVESFLRLAGGKVKKMTAITLAITGNALKAFPGIGTLTSGMIHAVAYGMIFDSLGRAAAETLASRGDLRPYPAAKAFEEMLNDNLEVSESGDILLYINTIPNLNPGQMLKFLNRIRKCEIVVYQ